MFVRRYFITVLFIFISMGYISLPLQAKFRQPEWRDLNSSITQKTEQQTIESRLHSQFRKWKGVRYQWGVTDTDGIDCSALTQKTYLTALKKHLPRTTGEQIKEGKQISVSELQPGDLIFFRQKKSVRHVGIYMGNNQFMHASGSMGVKLSSLMSPFWISHFEVARRIDG